jgi:hypothetical protein
MCRLKRLDLESVSVNIPAFDAVHPREPMLRSPYGAISIASVPHIDNSLCCLVRVAGIITDALGEADPMVCHRLLQCRHFPALIVTSAI